jgi:hypothetical protein
MQSTTDNLLPIYLAWLMGVMASDCDLCRETLATQGVTQYLLQLLQTIISTPDMILNIQKTDNTSISYSLIPWALCNMLRGINTAIETLIGTNRFFFFILIILYYIIYQIELQFYRYSISNNYLSSNLYCFRS